MERFLSALLAIMSLFGCFCNPVYAANEAEMVTHFSYTVGASYKVIIPDSVSLNDSLKLDFYASDVSLNNDERLIVRINPHSDQPIMNDGNMKLVGNQGEYITCGVKVGSSNDAESSRVTLDESNKIVAIFSTGINEPIKYGSMYFTPYGNGHTRGTYGCNINFAIEVSTNQSEW